MALNKENPTENRVWKQLQHHFEAIKSTSINQLFEDEPNRVSNFTVKWNDFLVDYSKNRMSLHTKNLLIEFSNSIGLKNAIASYFEGQEINETEKRAVLHTALRAKNTDDIRVNNVNVIPEIYSVKEHMKLFSNEIINGNRKGYTGKKFTDIVNIGIGGSDLGPAMVTEGLEFYKNHLNTHFVSNIDGDHVQEILKNLNPETTLFIVVSKTFTTPETLINSNTIKKWFLSQLPNQGIVNHFVAVTNAVEKATAFGIESTLIFSIWDWVGGRFSLWGGVGLSICLAIGNDNFEALLDGANEMDNHFKNEEFEDNIPVILALISIWYANFYGAETEAVIPYTQYLQKLPAYLQQGIMESNGKSIGRDGKRVNYQTGTIIWGETGSNSQHAFFQLIHQGTKLIPIDFIGFVKPLHVGEKHHHDVLMANFFSQTEALLNGKSEQVVQKELALKGYTKKEIDFLTPFKTFEGNKPSNTILIQKLTPKSLGALVAMYEHKIFVQGVIWNIFSYDQWGVELGKQLANSILQEMNSNTLNQHDASTSQLLKHYLEFR